MLSSEKDVVLRIAVLVIVFSVLAFLNPTFLTTASIGALIDGAALTGLVALGLGVTMLTRELDLAVGSTAALAGVVALQVIGFGLVPALVLGVMTGVVVGLMQGGIVAALGVNSLVLTVGTLIALRGLTYIVAGESTVVMPLALLDLADVLAMKFGPLTLLSIIMLVAFALVGALMRFTRLGREIRAIGDARAEARAAGVPVWRPLIVAFALSGGLAALAGAAMSVRSGSATPFGFEAVLLGAVTAALIGGVSLNGGRGSILGILVGVLTLRVLVAGMASLGAPFYIQSLATGVLLIAFVFLDLWIARRLAPAQGIAT